MRLPWYFGRARTVTGGPFGPGHILFSVNNYPPHVGGVQRHVAALAAALARRGWRATVVTLAEAPGEEVSQGIRIVRLRRHLPVADVLGFPAPGVVRRVVARLDEPVDVVSTHTRFFPMTWAGIALGRALGAPVVHTEHGSGFVSGGSAVVRLASRTVDRTLGRRALRRADRVLGVSDGVADFVDRLADVRAEVLPNAIDLAAWPRPVVPAPGPARLVFLGRLVDGKGWGDFLEAGSALTAEGRDVELHMIGDGEQRDAVARRARELGVAGVLRVHGALPPERIVPLLAGGVLVNPTVLSEGFQTSLIEAAVVGATTVSYPVAGIGMLQDAGAPIVETDPVPRALADGLRRVLDTPLAPMPAAAAETWGWDARAEEYERVLGSVRSGRPSG